METPFDKEKDQRKNFVFVEFESEESVDKVLNHTTENPEFKHSLGGEEVSWSCFIKDKPTVNNLLDCFIFFSCGNWVKLFNI